MGRFPPSIVVRIWGPNFGITKSAYQDLNSIFFAAFRFTACGNLSTDATLYKEGSLSIQRQDLIRVAIVYLMRVWAVLFNHFFMGGEIFPQLIVGGAIILWAVRRIFRG